MLFAQIIHSHAHLAQLPDFDQTLYMDEKVGCLIHLLATQSRPELILSLSAALSHCKTLSVVVALLLKAYIVVVGLLSLD